MSKKQAPMHIKIVSPDGEILVDKDIGLIPPIFQDAQTALKIKELTANGGKLDAETARKLIVEQEARRAVQIPMGSVAPVAPTPIPEDQERKIKICRRYLLAYCNFMRGKFSELSDDELMDVAALQDLTVLSLEAWEKNISG